jgi:magnesium transporter
VTPAPTIAGVDHVEPQHPEIDRKSSVACLQYSDHEHVVEHLEAGRFFWLDVDDPSEAQLQQLGQRLGLHPLTIEDARTFHERPKIEEFDTYVYLVIYGADPGATSGSPLLREVHLIVSGDYVVTIHYHPVEALSELRQRIETHPLYGEQRLIYKVIDAVIGTFFPVLSRIDDDIDEIEQEVISDPGEQSLRRIFGLKRDLVAMRRVVTPLRDVFARDAERITELPGLERDDRPYFRDLYDSLIRVSDLVDSYRDLLSGATDMYLSTVANRQGEVSKQLTIIATIFLPLTFLTGFFGQNFSFLTGHIENSTTAFIVLGVGLLVASTIGFLIYFRRKRWL